MKFIFSSIFPCRHSSCDRETTFCLMAEPEPAESASQSELTQSARAKYTCVCREGFYVPNETLQGFSSEKVEAGTGNFSCVPCPGGCMMCDNTGLCNLGHDEPEDIITESVLKASIGAVLGACVGCCLLLSFIVFRQRKCKVSQRR
jgi:G protein-coupled receptor 158